MRELSIFSVLTLGFSFHVAVECSELTTKQYEMELTTTQQSLQDARVQIANEQSRIAELKRQIAVVDQKKARFYSGFGFSENDVDTALLQISKFYQQLKNMMAVQNSPQKIDAALNEYSLKKDSLKASPMATLKLVSKKIAELEDLMKEISSMYQTVAKMDSSAVAQIDTANNQKTGTTQIYYTVKSNNSDRETLFKIAKSIYGNPYRWPEIYNANRTQIDSTYFKHQYHNRAQHRVQPSDFLLPGQVLVIPMNAAE